MVSPPFVCIPVVRPSHCFPNFGVPMPTQERRQIPRTSMTRIACIHIEPDNGGIVLNLSSEGLCFHSMTEVERNGSFHFALMENNRRIDASGELIWTDETKKIGGVKFKTLPQEARDQIQTWIEPPAVFLGQASTSGRFFARILPSLDTLKFRRKFPAGSFLSPAATAQRFRIRLSGFARGLATGLLISGVAMSGLMFVHAHRRQLGESLIRFGERLAPGQSSQPQRTPPPAETSAVAAQKNSPEALANERPAIASPTPRLLPRREPAPIQADSQLRRRDTFRKSDGNPPEILTPRPSPRAAASTRSDRAPVLQANINQGSLEASSPAAVAQPPMNLAILPAGSPPQLTFTAPVPSAPEEEIFHPSMYFDLGRFKDELRAQGVSNMVSRLGIRASIVQKRFLWRSSYQVLVGPYTNESEAGRVGRELSAHGYKPRPFERGSRSFAFGSGVTLNGTELPVGDFTISWESYVNSAKVKFFQHDGLMASVEGHWVRQDRRYRHNEYVYVRFGNGPRTLVEVHFSGMDRALVLGKVS